MATKSETKKKRPAKKPINVDEFDDSDSSSAFTSSSIEEVTIATAATSAESGGTRHKTKQAEKAKPKKKAKAKVPKEKIVNPGTCIEVMLAHNYDPDKHDP